MQIHSTGKSYEQHVIVLVLFLFCIVTIWNSSLIDWDEGVFALQGQWFVSIGDLGKPFNFQTPPLFQFIIAGAFALINVQWYVLPLISTICACLTLYVVYGISMLFFSKKQALIAMVLVLTTELFIFFSRSGLSDAIFLFFFTSAVYFFLSGINKNRIRDFVIAGIFITLLLYTKYSAAPLLVAFVIIGAQKRTQITKPWFLISVIVPLILFLPYIITFITVVRPALISSRHGPLLGINHLKYIHYLLIFAPVVFILGSVCLFNKQLRQQTSSLLIIAGGYLFCVGFYHPYMRLVLPLVPFCAILGAGFITTIKKFSYILLGLGIVINLFLSFPTITYSSDTSRVIGDQAEHSCTMHACHFIYAAVPPNVLFYIPGNILIPENHQWTVLGKQFPVFMRNKAIMKRGNNKLLRENAVIYVHATINDSLKDRYQELFASMLLVQSTDFIDAPLYYKDVFNPLRNSRQAYELYLVPLDTTSHVIEQLWQFGFENEMTVLQQ